MSTSAIHTRKWAGGADNRDSGQRDTKKQGWTTREWRSMSSDQTRWHLDAHCLSIVAPSSADKRIKACMSEFSIGAYTRMKLRHCAQQKIAAAATTRRRKVRLQQRQRQRHLRRTRQCPIHQAKRNPARCVWRHHARRYGSRWCRLATESREQCHATVKLNITKMHKQSGLGGMRSFVQLKLWIHDFTYPFFKALSNL